MLGLPWDAEQVKSRRKPPAPTGTTHREFLDQLRLQIAGDVCVTLVLAAERVFPTRGNVEGEDQGNFLAGGVHGILDPELTILAEDLRRVP